MCLNCPCDRELAQPVFLNQHPIFLGPEENKNRPLCQSPKAFNGSGPEEWCRLRRTPVWRGFKDCSLFCPFSSVVLQKIYGPNLGPPVVPFYYFVWEGSPTNLSTGGPRNPYKSWFLRKRWLKRMGKQTLELLRSLHGVLSTACSGTLFTSFFVKGSPLKMDNQQRNAMALRVFERSLFTFFACLFLFLLGVFVGGEVYFWWVLQKSRFLACMPGFNEPCSFFSMSPAFMS